MQIIPITVNLILTSWSTVMLDYTNLTKAHKSTKCSPAIRHEKISSSSSVVGLLHNWAPDQIPPHAMAAYQYVLKFGEVFIYTFWTSKPVRAHPSSNYVVAFRYTKARTIEHLRSKKLYIYIDWRLQKHTKSLAKEYHTKGSWKGISPIQFLKCNQMTKISGRCDFRWWPSIFCNGLLSTSLC